MTEESSARNGGYTYGFGYDPAGNPTTFKGAGHSFNASNQDAANTYDLEGNPTTYQGTGMTWDAEDRLTGIGASWTAGYRGDGLRAWKNNAGTKTYFLYDGGTPVVEMDGSGNVTAVNTFGAAGLLARKTSVGPSFYTFDLQGNLAQRFGFSGGVQASFNFDAFGVGHVTTAADPFGYGAQAGYYTDLETGLQAMSFRYYDAGAGRWLNRDPAGYGGGINLYGYCANGPAGRVDPDGLDALILWGRNYRNPPFFRNIAEAHATEYERARYGAEAELLGGGTLHPHAHVVHVESVREIQAALAGTRNIDTLMYFGHAGQGELFLSGKKLTLSDVGRLPRTNVMPGAEILLAGCHTGDPGASGVSTAQAFADHFGVTAYGARGGLSFGLPVFGVDLNPLGFRTDQPGSGPGGVDSVRSAIPLQRSVPKAEDIMVWVAPRQQSWRAYGGTDLRETDVVIVWSDNAPAQAARPANWITGYPGTSVAGRRAPTAKAVGFRVRRGGWPPRPGRRRTTPSSGRGCSGK